jgi:hypothetical protein
MVKAKSKLKIIIVRIFKSILLRFKLLLIICLLIDNNKSFLFINRLIIKILLTLKKILIQIIIIKKTLNLNQGKKKEKAAGCNFNYD